MKTCGIVAEYNPFHNGHAYQIAEAKRLSGAHAIIVVMSGNFVQRGEPAVIDKWQRAEAACRNGADLVIELPYMYATQAASGFAHGAITLLKLAGVDSICFGSECGNLENLLEIAETPVNPDHLHVALGQGLSYPKAYSLLTSSMAPNDILGVSYLKEITGTDIKPYVVERTGGYLDEKIKTNASALAIRTALRNHVSLQSSTVMEEALLNNEIPWPEKYWPYLRTYLLTSSREQLAGLFLYNEGIENHIVKNAAAHNDWDAFLNACTNYRYTKSRIRRCLLQAMVQVSKEEVKKLPRLNTLRVLAFNETGRQWLHDMRKNDVRIASRFADVPYPWRVMEYRSTLLYTSVMSPEQRTSLLKQEIAGAHFVK